MLRWALLLSAYIYNIQFRPTKQQANADGLSRSPLADATPVGNSREANLRQLESLPMTVLEVSKDTRADPILPGALAH